MSEIDAYLGKKMAEIEQLTIRNLEYVGERCIVEARSNGAYMDQTGNLRSSIGYVIVNNGKIVSISSFEKANGGSSGAVGQKDGEAYAKTIAKEFRRGIVLIVVAGMNYASAVSARGKNVIDSAELLAEQLVPTLMARLKKTR